MEVKFTNKVVVITGGGRRIGFAIARMFAAARASVDIADIYSVKGNEAAASILQLGY